MDTRMVAVDHVSYRYLVSIPLGTGQNSKV